MQSYRKLAAITILSLSCVNGAYADALVSLSITNLTAPIYKNETYKNVELHVNNLTSKPLYVNQLNAPSYPEGFTVTANTCTDVTVAVGGYCKVVGTFAPTKVGSHTWAAAVAAENYLWQLEYTAAVDVSDSSTRLGMLAWKTPLPAITTIGAPASNVVLNVTNDTNDTITFDNPAINFVASDPEDFSATPTTTCGTMLAVGANCTFTWQYQFLKLGTKTLTASVNYNGSRSSAAVTTTSNAADYQVTPIVEPEHCRQCSGFITPNAPQTVAVGSTATFSLAPEDGATLLGASSDCGGGSLINLNTYITGPVKRACSVYAAFAKKYNGSLISNDLSADFPTLGDDGKIWFIDMGTSRLGNVSASGVTQYFVNDDRALFAGLTKDNDGHLWALSWRNPDGYYVNLLNNDGTITNKYQIESGIRREYSRLVSTADGSLWSTVDGYSTGGGWGIIRFSVALGTKFYPMSEHVENLTVANGNTVWYESPDDDSAVTVGRIAADGTQQEFHLPIKKFSTMVEGADHNIWITADKLFIKMSPEGKILNSYQIPLPDYFVLQDITKGADGNLWFISVNNDAKVGKNKNSQRRLGANDIVTSYIGKVTTGGLIALYPLNDSYPLSLSVGSDNNLWIFGLNNDGNRLVVYKI